MEAQPSRIFVAFSVPGPSPQLPSRRGKPQTASHSPSRKSNSRASGTWLWPTLLFEFLSGTDSVLRDFGLLSAQKIRRALARVSANGRAFSGEQSECTRAKAKAASPLQRQR